MDLRHLDDDRSFVVDDSMRTAVHRRAGQLRRRRAAKVAAGASLLATLVVVLTAAAWATWQAARLERVEVGNITPVDDGEPAHVLLVGTDKVGGNADTVMLARIDQSGGQVTILSLPRDLWIDDAAGHRDLKLGSVLPVAGRDALVAEVEELVGVEVNHYVELDIDGLHSVVDAHGGVAVTVHAPVRDRGSGLDLQTGCRELDGQATVALARSRHLETWDEVDQRWVEDPGHDASRIGRGQVLLLAALLELHDLDDPFEVARVVDAFTQHATVDDALSAAQALGWASWARSLPPDAVDTAVAPVETVNVRYAAMLALVEPAASQLFDAFRAGEQLPSRQPDPSTGAAPDAVITPGC